ncbi:peptide ABC transporter permease [Streptomyces cinereoruber]|uniref:ABC transporter permease n=1 Tax=Streptomyces cinereoruber TaxID=67260 RepID=A0AAV4KI49_9ACTN|nr:ABC transporter permease [Streptomyces cinereoruber]MBB4159094.1 peptide/nickel transport system permease protein [Streptomyces cinereoruber]MBY8816816.1 ABC transporter permease [Streptomyces cinereoruber]NIH63215.1 peptide/nickel transport system permease protein [Streptomyces cinereoruber]QEV31261.1 ABC transporter permease [Streptomyces cinereoruber]GGR17866.1 peptide ABC transporter permease [Streptomyces cinereoruber]
MRGYLLRRLPSALLVLLVASFVVFAVLRLVPGDPAAVLAGPDASAETEAAIRARLGLDEPLPAQYLRWLGDLLTGDLGPSYAIGGQTADLIGDGLGATAELTLGALLFVVVLGGTFGILGATSRNRWVSGAVRILTTGALSVPPFVTGVLLVLLFSVLLGVLPPGGRIPLLTAPDLGVQYLLLPALCLALPSAAVLGRYLKDGIERALGEDYVRTATAAGIAPRRLLWRHVLPNALPPVVTLLGMQTGNLLGGAVLVEAIFAWPGLGQLAEQALVRRDYPVVQDLLLLLVTVFVLVQLLTDFVHARLDPRIRWE